MPVDGDRDRLSQVLGNLLDNAVHAAGEQGHVRVGVAQDDHRHEHQHGRTVTLRVSDVGPGVPLAQQERIFERMVRLDRSRSTRTGGVGLGLPIARGLGSCARRRPARRTPGRRGGCLRRADPAAAV